MARARTTLSAERLRDLAKSGAEATLTRLRAEVAAIERAFPELATPAGRQALKRSAQSVARRTRTMSAAARKEVSVRMKKYWAERRRAKAGGK